MRRVMFAMITVNDYYDCDGEVSEEKTLLDTP
jgi:hypothetical protein